MNTSNGHTPRGSVRTTTRRTVIATLIAAPGVAIGARAMAKLRNHAARVRPTATGSSISRCAACGDEGHSMLSCPSAPEVL